MLCDDRTRERGAEKVLALVDGPRAKRRKCVFPEELLAQVPNICLRGAAPKRFRLYAGKIIRLADVCGEGYDFAVVVLFEPGNDCGRVQSARIGQNNLAKFLFAVGTVHEILLD